MRFLRFLLAAFLHWLLNLIEPAMASSMQIGVTSDVGAVANAGAAAMNLITELQKDANSPDQQIAAAAQKKLNAMDALARAQRNNDLEAERKAVEEGGQ